jgi:uncharacterized protein (TIGR00730 family)
MELHFTRTNGLVDDLIDEIMKTAGPVCCHELVREMILTALKAGIEEADEADLKLMNTTLKEMRFTAKVFGPYRVVRKVTVFGSARTKPTEPIYKLATLTGKKLAEAGYMIITGGGPGIMQAANEGAGPEYSFAVNIRLPFEQKPNPVVDGNMRSITFKYFFNRKVAFLKQASAVVLFPGGFGTLDEAMETLTLIQTGKHDPVPLILIDEPGGNYWSRWIRFFKQELLADGYIGASDFSLFELVDSAEAVVRSIAGFYARYHSLRYVDGQLVIRMTSALDEQALDELTEKFSDILTPQSAIRLSGPVQEEDDEPEIADLPRLLIDFNRRNFGRLRSLINAINSY